MLFIIYLHPSTVMKGFKKVGLGVVGVGKSAATTTVSVASAPVRTINKAKVFSDSHDASHYSESKHSEKKELEEPRQKSVRLSQLEGKPLKSLILSASPVSSTLPLIIDDIGYGKNVFYKI